MECKNCHVINEEGNKYCNNCGTELVSEVVTEESNPVQEEVKEEPVVEPTTVTPEQAPVTENASQTTPVQSEPVVVKNTGKKSNVALIVIISVVSFLIVGALAFFGVRSFFNKATNEVNNVVNTANNIINNNTNNNSKTVDKTKVVGEEKYGYVTVPSDWVKFYDYSTVANVLQYSYANEYVLTMMYYSKDELRSAETAAANAKAHLSTENVEKLTGAKVKMGSYDAYQVYAYYPDENEWLVCWFFEAEDGLVHYLAVEGPDPYSDYFEIPNTFKIKK